MRSKALVRSLVLLSCLLCQDILAETASLKGSPASLRRQLEMAVEAGVVQIMDDVEFWQMQDAGILVPISGVRVDSRLEARWHWLLPSAAMLLQDLNREFLELSQVSLQLNSAARTVPRQIELEKTNPNAAPIQFAAHTRGTTFDLARFVWVGGRKVWYPDEHRARLEGRLLELEEQGLIEVTREEKQAVYHVTVSPEYRRPEPDWWLEPLYTPAPSPTLVLAARGGICLVP